MKLLVYNVSRPREMELRCSLATRLMLDCLPCKQLTRYKGCMLSLWAKGEPILGCSTPLHEVLRGGH